MIVLLISILCCTKIVYAQTVSEKQAFEPNLVLFFVPRNGTKLTKASSEPLGALIDNKPNFNAAAYEKEPALAPYGDMQHGLLWQGFFKAGKDGLYLFSGHGKGSAGCSTATQRC